MDLVDRAERIGNLRRYPGGHDKRSAAEYLADLVAQADRELQRSPSWRADQPLHDHRGDCDCPKTLAGCVQRRGWPTVVELGSGNIDGRRRRDGDAG